jgi:hypothetical protein
MVGSLCWSATSGRRGVGQLARPGGSPDFSKSAERLVRRVACSHPPCQFRVDGGMSEIAIGVEFI